MLSGLQIINHLMNGAKIWSVLLLVAAAFFVGLAQDPKLIYVQEVFRHGARYPIYPSSKDNSAYAASEKSTGELTKQGKSMHYVLGKALYDEYYSRLFGTNKIYNQSKFYVKSTNVNRTIESVQSQLLGIFENIDKLTLSQDDLNYSLPQWPGLNRQAGDVYVNSPQFNPVPVHVEKGPMSPWDNGDFLRTYSSEFCYKQESWIQANKQDDFVKEVLANANFNKALNALNAQLKTNITFWDVYKYYDNAQCMLYQRRNGILPIFTENSDNRKALDAIYVLDAYMKMFYTEQQLKTTSTGYFNETVNHFKRVTNNQDGVQWAFYSAHDTTVANFLSRLGLTSAKCIYQSYLAGNMKNTNSCIAEYPKYTSNIIFEVYQYKTGANVFKIRYNGQYYQIPFCNNKVECPVETLYSWFDSWKDVDYVKTCGVKDSTQETYFSIIVIEFGIIIFFVIAGVLSYLNKKSDAAAQVAIKKSDQELARKRESAPVPTKSERNVLQESLLTEEQ